jgi:glycoside/pentoside/hexuronide:cation symporter, GPH family
VSAAAAPRAVEWSWAAGSLATASVTNAMSLYALFFMTTVLALPAALAGSLLLVSKLYDAVTDPIMGVITDRTRHRLGRRRPYLIAGAIATAAAFAAFFNLAPAGSALTPWLALLALLLFSTAYTVYSVPYLAMPPDLAPSYDGRTRLMSYRVLFIMAGVLLGAAGAPALLQWLGSDAQGFGLLGLAMAAVVVLSGVVAFLGTARMPAETAVPTERVTLRTAIVAPWRDVRAVFGNAPFRVLTLVKLLQLAVLSVALACTPYFFSQVLRLPPAGIATFQLVFTGAGLLALPLLRMLIGRLGKKRAYQWLLLSYGLATLSWLAWQPGESSAVFYGRAVWIGVSSIGTLLCTLALLPDTMEYDRVVSGEAREGVMSGVFTLVEKVSGALGPFIIGVLLQSAGMISGAAPGIQQPASALEAVRLGMSVVPAVLTLACIPLLWFYDLPPERLAAARAAAGTSAGRVTA